MHKIVTWELTCLCSGITIRIGNDDFKMYLFKYTVVQEQNGKTDKVLPKCCYLVTIYLKNNTKTLKTFLLYLLVILMCLDKCRYCIVKMRERQCRLETKIEPIECY